MPAGDRQDENEGSRAIMDTEAAILDEMVVQIDAEIATRNSDGFGIRMGEDLYRGLFRSGLLTIEKFSITGITFFECDAPAYKKKFHVYMDPGMKEWKFEVGDPNPPLSQPSSSMGSNVRT